ncbi:MAG: DUF484 family protein [Alphaproteobacteria bacterium]|nr:DUF484 family protein [Alphaproteobacteria bacterium]
MSEPESNSVDPEAVRRYLEDHPEFLLENVHILKPLLPPGEEGNVVDFRPALIERLRDQLREQMDYQEALVATSRSNMTSQRQIHDTTLALIEAESLEYLLTFVGRELADFLRIDFAGIAAETSLLPYLALYGDVIPLEDGEVASRFANGEMVLLRACDDSSAALFGPAAPLMLTEALIDLDQSQDNAKAGLKAMLVLGDRGEQTFHPGQATGLLRYLGQVLALKLSQLLPDEPMTTDVEWAKPDR